MSNGTFHGTACKNCRRRGRKCDRTLPTCLSCKSRGTPCEGYITRWPGVAARGKLAGKSIPVGDSIVSASKNKVARTRHACSAAIKSTDDRSASLSRQAGGSSSTTHNLVSHDSSSKENLSPVEDADIEQLVKHCMSPFPLLICGIMTTNTQVFTDIKDLSNIFYLGNGRGSNPMFCYVLPLVDSVPPLRYALAASASCHIAARNADKALERKSLFLRVQATGLLRERLRSSDLKTDPTILASILMLAQLDMCSGDCLEFETHLKAAVAIVRARPNENKANKYYFEQRLAWLDVISSTTSTELPNFTIEELKTSLGRFCNANKREWSYDVFPCPIDLFEMLLDITMLYKTRLDGTSQLKQAEYIMSRLVNWKNPANGSDFRQHMLEVWRFGIMAYLGRLFPSADNLTDAEARTTQALHCADLIPPATSWSYSLLWPIFQLGAVLDTEALDAKAWIRKRLNLAFEAAGCRHFSNALETLESIWADHIQHLFPPVGAHGRRIMLG